MLYELHSVPEVHPGAVAPLMVVYRLWIADNCHFGSLCQVRKLTDMDERAMYLSKSHTVHKKLIIGIVLCINLNLVVD